MRTSQEVEELADRANGLAEQLESAQIDYEDAKRRIRSIRALIVTVQNQQIDHLKDDRQGVAICAKHGKNITEVILKGLDRIAEEMG